MATKTVVCPTCEAPVEPGRYACLACGSLLVAVAATRRSMATEATPTAVPPPSPVAEPADAAPDDDPWLDPASVDAIDEDAGLILAGAPAEPDAGAGPGAEPDARDPLDEPHWPGDPGLPAWAGGAAPEPAATAPEWPPQPVWPPAAPAGDAPAPETHDRSDPRPPAGAYLPPSAVLPPGEALPLASKRAAPGPASSSATGLAAAARALEAPADLPSRMIAAGAGIAGIGFLLPWSETVVGSGAFGGYTASWGLAGPGHLLVVVGLFGVWGLAMLSERLGGRIRPGLVAVGLGALLVGLVWPYLFGLLGAQFGTWVVVAGAVALITGGALELRAPRHPADGSAVEVGPGSEPGP